MFTTFITGYVMSCICNGCPVSGVPRTPFRENEHTFTIGSSSFQQPIKFQQHSWIYRHKSRGQICHGKMSREDNKNHKSLGLYSSRKEMIRCQSEYCVIRKMYLTKTWQNKSHRFRWTVRNSPMSLLIKINFDWRA